MYEIEGDEEDDKGDARKETVELWRRDPVECVRELIGNPAFHDGMHFAPRREYEDEGGTQRIYDEMWTADWWWDTQVSQSTYYPITHSLT